VASGRTLGKQVIVAILNLLRGLTSVGIDSIAQEREETTCKPKVVVAPDEASVESDGTWEASEEEGRPDFPHVDHGGLLHAKLVEWAILGTKSSIKFSDFFRRDLSEELSCSNLINFSEAMLKLDGVTVAGEEILEQTAEILSSGVLVNLVMIKVFAGGSVPLV